MVAIPHPDALPAAASPPTGAPPQLSFAVTGAAAELYSAAPMVSLTLDIERAGGGPVRSVMLDVQIQIAARRRSYDRQEQERLLELFGTPERWSDTLRTLLWTRASLVVPPFETRTVVGLPVSCTYDMEVAAASYISGLGGGEVPLELLFSGTVLYNTPSGLLNAARISWEAEAEYRLPVSVWRQAMDRHFPGTAWLRVSPAAFEKVRACKAEQGLASTQDALDYLLAGQ